MYLDTGLGGMLIQIIAALIVIAVAVIIAMRKRIHALFTKNKVKDDPAANRNDADAGSPGNDAADTASDKD